MKNASTIPIKYIDDALKSIGDDALAISELSRFIHELKIDCWNMDEKDRERFPSLKRFRDDLDDFGVMHSIEAMAKNITDRVYHLEVQMQYLQRQEEEGEDGENE